MPERKREKERNIEVTRRSKNNDDGNKYISNNNNNNKFRIKLNKGFIKSFSFLLPPFTTFTM